MKHRFEQYDRCPEELTESHFTLDNLDAIFYFGAMFWREASPGCKETVAHEHAWYEFHCVKKGCLEVKTDEKTHLIKANEALFIPPRVYHNTRPVEDDTQYIGLGFELVCNKKNTAEQLFQAMTSVFSVDNCVKLTKCRQLVGISHELLTYANKGGSPDRCRFHNMLTTFLFQVYDKLHDSSTSASSPQLPAETAPDMRNYLLDYLTSTKINNITLEELSQKIYLNKKQINRIVKKRYNMTFKQKQIRFRIENAKKQLTETNLSVDQIALLVGYTNLTSFYKAFRQIVGVTPKVYRNQAFEKTEEGTKEQATGK
ncbi:MAG: helix-turn-helix domain-containing protein [Ruminococcaceae bacterium]|nr:helix-turn-helix domain-containing protein [Oscillospiraceae bacterium]